MRRGYTAALLAIAALLVSVPSASAAPLPADFFGVSSPDLIGNSPSFREPILADQRAAGVKLLRQLFDWSAIESTEGSPPDWTATDSFMASAAGAGMNVLPVMLYSPTWASSCQADSTHVHRCPPTDYTDFGNFVVAAIDRYGPDGSFWTDHPEVPKLPITSWQLWNEPAIPAYWYPTPNAAEYVQMLQTAVPMIRAEDPSAEIVAAGIPDSRLPGAIPMSDYVSGMYTAGVKGLVDDVAIHIYDDTPDNAVGLVEQTRANMNANGDSATPIWITEWGWASAGKPNKFVTTLDGQAANTSALMSELVARHEELGLRGLTEYFWHDGSAQSNNTDVWDNHLGLVDVNYAHKPAYDAFQANALDSTAPDTGISSGPVGTVPPGPQSVAFSSTQAGSDFECRLDGGAWSSCTSPVALPQLPDGLHALLVRATDPYGNTDPTPASLEWVVQTPQPPPAIAVSPTRVSSSRLIAASAKSLAKRLARLDLRKLARRHVQSVRVLWPAAGRITIALDAGRIRVARGSLTLNRAGRAMLRLRITRSGRRVLSRSRKLKLRLTETFTPRSGEAGTVARASFVLRRSP